MDQKEFRKRSSMARKTDVEENFGDIFVLLSII
jgi:hypothetical protein